MRQQSTSPSWHTQLYLDVERNSQDRRTKTNQREATVNYQDQTNGHHEVTRVDMHEVFPFVVLLRVSWASSCDPPCQCQLTSQTKLLLDHSALTEAQKYQNLVLLLQHLRNVVKAALLNGNFQPFCKQFFLLFLITWS